MLGVGGAAGVEKRGEGARVRFIRKFCAEAGGDGLDAVPAFGDFYDATEHGALAMIKIFGDGDVGGDHEAFDEVLGDVVPRDGEVGHDVVFDDSSWLHGFEGEAAVFPTD